MRKATIYGLLNEDREIVFISDWQEVDWFGDYDIAEDADWKMIYLNDNGLIDEIGGVEWENVVVLERIKGEEEEIKEMLGEWVNVIRPKYRLDYISPEELMTFRINKERDWEEDDQKLLADN